MWHIFLRAPLLDIEVLCNICLALLRKYHDTASCKIRRYDALERLGSSSRILRRNQWVCRRNKCLAREMA